MADRPGTAGGDLDRGVDREPAADVVPDAAALEEVQRVGGVSLAIGFTVGKDLAAGRLINVKGPGLQVPGEWCVLTLAPAARQPAVSELVRFITTPRCTQAMLRGTGVGVTRFRPRIHVTLWS